MQKTFTDRYPGLRALAKSFGDGQPENQDPLFKLGSKLCQVLLTEQTVQTRCLGIQNSFQEWLEESSQPAVDFAELIPYMADYGVSFNNLLADLAEEAARLGHGLGLAKVLQKVALKTQEPVCSFLAAWIFLNLNQLPACIAECQRVNSSYGPVQGLLGQALLESGKLEEAIQALQAAVRSSPEDLLSWFLLSKANLAANHWEAAWECIQICKKLAPEHEEVKAMIAIIAEECAENSLWLRTAWEEVHPIWLNNSGRGFLTALLYRLAFLLNEPAKADYITSHADWQQLKVESDFLQNLAGILREFHRRQWHKENKRFLERLTVEGMA